MTAAALVKAKLVSCPLGLPGSDHQLIAAHCGNNVAFGVVELINEFDSLLAFIDSHLILHCLTVYNNYIPPGEFVKGKW
jgi:hypothetical protein